MTVTDGQGSDPATDSLTALRQRTAEVAAQVGHPLRLLVGKPGLDGHSNGAEQVAVRAKDAGFEVIYQGIRLTPEQIVASALEEDVDAIGLSIHSGSHMTLVPRLIQLLREAGLEHVGVLVGGIIPETDVPKLREMGVARVFGPGTALPDIVAFLHDNTRRTEPSDAAVPCCLAAAGLRGRGRRRRDQLADRSDQRHTVSPLRDERARGRDGDGIGRRSELSHCRPPLRQ